jgi:hypothetical protein
MKNDQTFSQMAGVLALNVVATARFRTTRTVQDCWLPALRGPWDADAVVGGANAPGCGVVA